MSRFAKSIAASLRSMATSRIEGLTNGTPPRLIIMCAISSARRLSNEATRKPANDDELPLKAEPLQLLTKIELPLERAHAKALRRRGNNHKDTKTQRHKAIQII